MKVFPVKAEGGGQERGLRPGCPLRRNNTLQIKQAFIGSATLNAALRHAGGEAPVGLMRQLELESGRGAERRRWEIIRVRDGGERHGRAPFLEAVFLEGWDGSGSSRTSWKHPN